MATDRGDNMKESIQITIEGNKFEAKARTFQSGKKGYGLYEKLAIGEDRFQLSINIIKIN